MTDDQNELFKFKSYLSEISGVKAYIQYNDNGANAVPYWNIKFDETWDLSVFNEATIDVLMNLKITLVVDIKNSSDAARIMVKTLKKINQFDYASGSMIGDDNLGDSKIGTAEVEPETDENNLMLSFPYKLKMIIQDIN